MLNHFSNVQLFATPWTVRHQALLSMEILQARILELLPCPPPGDLPDPGIKPGSPAWQVDSLPPSKLVKVFLSLLSTESLNSPEWLLHWVINVQVFPYAMILCSIKRFGDTVFLKRVSFCNLLAWFLLFAVKSGPSDPLRSPVSYVAEFRFKPSHSDFRMTNWSLC